MIKTFAIICFIAMYVVMVIKTEWRTYTAMTVAALFIVFGVLPFGSIFGAVDWNVLLMISGTMILVDYFIESKMPNRIADLLLDKSRNVMWVAVFMSLFSGAVSAFIDNVATVLMVAPVGLAICKKLKTNPVPMLLSIAVSSNLQGAATLVGDTTSIMLGAYAKMDFTHFFWMNGRPGIFFAVELGALATVPVIMFLFRHDTQPVHCEEKTEEHDYFPSFMLCGVVVALILASFLPNKPAVTNGLLCCIFAAVTALRHLLRTHSTAGWKHAMGQFDYQTVLMLVSIFLVIGGLEQVGVIDDLSGIIASFGKSNLFLLYTVIVWGSVVISAFIDNIPYVATMLPVIRAVSMSLGIEPYLLYFGLLTGATLGGNLTPVGASANIAATGILKKEGYEVSFQSFMKIGVPFTLTAVTVGYLFLWLVWK